MAPAPGLSVASLQPPTLRRTRTDPSGTFTLVGLDEGQTQLIVSQRSSHTALLIRDLTITAHSPLLELVIERRPSGRVVGQVLDTRGRPARGLWVRALRGSPVAVDAQGGFALDSLEVGTVELEVFEREGARLAVDGDLQVTVRANQVTTARIRVVEGGRITGQVVETDGTPSKRGTLVIFKLDGAGKEPEPGRFVPVDGGGNFVIDAIGPHGYVLQAASLDRLSEPSAVVHAGAEVTLTVPSRRVLRGRVEGPPGEVELRLVRNDLHVERSAKVTVPGDFTMEGVEPDDYALLAEGPGGSAASSVDLRASSQEDVHLVLDGGTTAVGQIVDGSSQPLPGALAIGESGAMRVTGEDGRFSLPVPGDKATRLAFLLDGPDLLPGQTPKFCPAERSVRGAIGSWTDLGTIALIPIPPEARAYERVALIDDDRGRPLFVKADGTQALLVAVGAVRVADGTTATCLLRDHPPGPGRLTFSDGSEQMLSQE